MFDRDRFNKTKQIGMNFARVTWIIEVDLISSHAPPTDIARTQPSYQSIVNITISKPLCQLALMLVHNCFVDASWIQSAAQGAQGRVTYK